MDQSNQSNDCEFKQYQLPELENIPNLFSLLESSVDFEKTGKGRLGANLLDITSDQLYPIVRTTTAYAKPNQPFKEIHYELIKLIKSTVKSTTNLTNQNISFNNAMIEIYDNSYKNMGYHTDQSLDLVDDSYICIFSSYSVDNVNPDRYLQIKNKSNDRVSDICLKPNSIILFDTTTNKNHVHKIYLNNLNRNQHKWLGITFRLSKTFIKFINEIPYFSHNNKPLKLASAEELLLMRHLKYLENTLTDYVYPYDQINFTISNGEFIEPVI